MRIGSIDIGTNTVLLLIADVLPDGTLLPVHHEQRLPRLGRDVDASGMIQPPAFERVSRIVNEYLTIARRFSCDHVVACATSAVRDARNGRDFADALRRTTGLEPEILPGAVEAEVTFAGAISGMQTSGAPIAVLDIGGGSTELTHRNPGSVNGDHHLVQYSLQLGAVRLSERFFGDQPALPPSIISATQVIHEELAVVRNPGFGGYRLIGVAGTATTLACLDQELAKFEVARVSGYRMSYERINSWFIRLAGLTPAEIAGLSPVTEGREDILTAGVLILREVMHTLGFASMIVSERGLRYGYLLACWKRLTTG